MSVRKTVRVDVQYAARPAGGLPSEREVSRWVKAALADRREGAQLVVRFVGEAEGRELNERYRGKLGATNVLSFTYDGPGVLEPPFLGDIVVCAPVAQSEASEQGKSLRAHWAHLVVHGVLHLRGYDHEHERDASIMEALEREAMDALGFPDPYAAGDDAAPAIRPRARTARDTGR